MVKQISPKKFPNEAGNTDKQPPFEEITNAQLAADQVQDLLCIIATDARPGTELDLQIVMPEVLLLTENIITNPSALTWLMRMQTKNAVACTHGLKVAIYMMTLGRHLGFARQQLKELGLIGLLLDVGKLSLPDELLKKPGKLSKKERALIQTHVSLSLSTLQAENQLPPNVLLGISEHHERLNGSGYPQGISGAQISIYGRMAAIADSFSAMTSLRSYAPTRSAFDAMKELFNVADTQLHGPLIEEFVQAIGIFPVGSLAELTSGEVAIVLKHNKLKRLEPDMLVLTDREKTILSHPWTLNLMEQSNFSVNDNARIRILRDLSDGAYGIDSHLYYQATR